MQSVIGFFQHERKKITPFDTTYESRARPVFSNTFKTKPTLLSICKNFGYRKNSGARNARWNCYPGRMYRKFKKEIQAGSYTDEKIGKQEEKFNQENLPFTS